MVTTKLCIVGRFEILIFWDTVTSALRSTFFTPKDNKF